MYANSEQELEELHEDFDDDWMPEAAELAQVPDEVFAGLFHHLTV